MYVVQRNIIQGDANSDRATGQDFFKGTGSSPRKTTSPIYVENVVSHKTVQVCSRCKTVYYCSKRCQSAHWRDHQSFCTAIVNMVAKEEKEWLEQGQYVSHLTPVQQNAVIKLVGNRCLIKCLIGVALTEALLDMGAQVSIALHNGRQETFLILKLIQLKI